MMATRHAIHRVKSFSWMSAYTLCVTFADETEQVIDFEPLLRGELFGPLRDPTLFRQVSIDPIAHTLVWPNGADFDPAILHEWPDRGPAVGELAASWSRPKAP